ncbi:hypothetical protein HOD38_05560 [archaeon]|jgi:hypothetical protein|nr:hypothetical protein [archaeon]MBT4397708.1 hypothetical protein [archaeon]MBT4441596.1 hypothetical protein [archaeon]
MIDSKEDAIKDAFSRVKDHIAALEIEIKANRDFIIKQNKQLLTLMNQLKDQNSQIQALEGPKPQNSLDSSLKNEDSSGNKGVSLDGYSLPGYSLDGYSLNIQEFQENLPTLLSSLSKQEFLTFLTIYQLEEEISKVTYDDVAQNLKITSGCIRTYVSGLIKKGLPVLKSKYNNKVIILSIPPEIRSLNMKKKLVNTFYNLDPTQKKLNDGF